MARVSSFVISRRHLSFEPWSTPTVVYHFLKGHECPPSDHTSYKGSCHSNNVLQTWNYFRADMAQQKDTTTKNKLLKSIPASSSSELAEPASTGDLRIFTVTSCSDETIFCLDFTWEDTCRGWSAWTSTGPINQHTYHLFLTIEHFSTKSVLSWQEERTPQCVHDVFAIEHI